MKKSVPFDLDAECKQALEQIEALHDTDVFEEYDVRKVISMQSPAIRSGAK